MGKILFSPIREGTNIVTLSGQIGIKDGKLVSEDVKEQTKQAVTNIERILKQNSMDLRNVIDVTVFITNQDDYASLNEVYEGLFSEPYPTRTVVTVKSLPMNAKIELKLILSK